jgi:hypothetical protein
LHLAEAAKATRALAERHAFYRKIIQRHVPLLPILLLILPACHLLLGGALSMNVPIYNHRTKFCWN